MATGSMMTSAPSMQLRCLIPLLRPVRSHISRLMSWQQPDIFHRHSKDFINFSHHFVTHPDVKIEQKADGSEYIFHKQLWRSPKGLLVYFHGGAFLAGSPQAVRPITSNLVGQTPGLGCYSVKYPIGFPVEKIIEVGVQVYQRILSDGWSPNQIILGGDSAGGHLALSVVLRLIELEKNELIPNSLLLLSPWLDLTGQTAIDDPIIHASAVRQAGEMVNQIAKQNEQDCENDQFEPRILYQHPEIDQLPSIYLQYGKDEIVSEESRELARVAIENKVVIEIDEIPEVFHGFHYFANYLPESQQALTRISQFLKSKLD